jgi:hypothetical protein
MYGRTKSHFFRIILSFCIPCSKNVEHAGRDPLAIDIKTHDRTVFAVYGLNCACARISIAV